MLLRRVPLLKKISCLIVVFGMLGWGQASAQTWDDLLKVLQGKGQSGQQNQSPSPSTQPQNGSKSNKNDRFKNSTGTVPSQGNTNSNIGAGLNNNEATSGLKQALEIGAQNATRQLSAMDGFYANAAVKILMPPEVEQVTNTLRSIGMGKLVDDAVLSMNRAAEDAAKKAAPIFVNAIKTMTIQDGLQILRGGNHAATDYLQGRTTTQLTTAFSPIVAQSLRKTNATKMWTEVFQTYNKIPMVKKVNPNLGEYVTQKAIEGIFIQIAAEELKIRTDPAAQVTNLLKRVFGR